MKDAAALDGSSLKPCPFCGSPATLENFVIEAQVRCIASFCGAKIVRKHPAKEDAGVARAVSAWNRRRDDKF